VPNSSVVVEVLNGSGASDAATTTGAALHAAGFALNGTANAASFDYTTSAINYSPGHVAAAETLLEHINGPTQLIEDSSLQGNNVDLVIGSSFKGIIS
jgi:hypothetical protein